MNSFHSYSSIFNLGHKAVSDILKGPVYVEEKVDGCVTPDTLILKSDLKYVAAGTLVVGDRLLAFDDTLNDPRLRESIVTVSNPLEKICYKVELDDRIVEASADHPWLVHQHTNHNGKRWIKTEDLKSGMEIISFPLWSYNSSYESGYLAGFFDGEGTCFKSKNQRVLAAYQRIGDTCDFVLSLLKLFGFHFSVDVRKRKAEWSEVASMVLRNESWVHILRFLGTIRPVRLLENAYSVWNNSPLNGVPRTKVIRICHVGKKTVQGLSTTTKTYIANGLFCHNSQFSFGAEEDGTLRVRSKGCELVVDAPEKMFTLGVETVKRLKPLLHPGWTYRCEYLRSPKHNALIYSRIPKDHLIIFDIEIDECEFLSYNNKEAEAKRLGLEVVPLLFAGTMNKIETFRDFLKLDSVLGGQKIEGVVVKPIGYGLFGIDKKVLMGKFVSEAFKEVHAHAWKADNPTAGDIVARLGADYGTQARWQKAIQHLSEQGKISDSPQDIGALMEEVPADVKRECEDEIKEKLFIFAWPHIARMTTRGLPEWYKDSLLRKQFEETTNEKAAIDEEASCESAQDMYSIFPQDSAAD